MAINYKIKKVVDAVSKDKKDVFRAFAVKMTTFDSESLAEFISDQCSLTSADVKGIMAILCDAIHYYASDSYIVDLDYLGNFRYSPKAPIISDPKNFTSRMINGVKVIYNPGSSIKRKLSLAKLEKFNPIVEKDV